MKKNIYLTTVSALMLPSIVLASSEVLPDNIIKDANTAEAKVISYAQTTKLEKKMADKVELIKNNLENKIKSNSAELRRLKIEEIDNVKNLKLKLVSDYDAYMAELKKQSNELKVNRYMRKEFQELQGTIVELTMLHQKNQKELKTKLNGLIDNTYKTRNMLRLEELITEQNKALLKISGGFDSVYEHHSNHKKMLKDKFYVDLENLKRKYLNDNSKLQELFKINVNELAKDVDSRKNELKLDYREGK